MNLRGVLTRSLAIVDVGIVLKDFFEFPLFLLDYLEFLVKHLDLLVSSAEHILGSLELKLLLSEYDLSSVRACLLILEPLLTAFQIDNKLFLLLLDIQLLHLHLIQLDL